MNRREKIILLVTLGVVLYGFFDFLILSKSNDQESPNLAKKSQATHDFVTGAMAKISGIEHQDKNNNWQAWASLIESDWDQDPFVRYSEPKTKNNKKKSSGAGLVFSGFMLTGHKTFAIINGMEYKTGENIEPQGFLVKKITSTKVILQRNSEQIILYLKED